MSVFSQVSMCDSTLPLELAPEEMRWYALHTRSRHERVAAQQLREFGLETYVPTVREVHRWSDRQKKVEVPLFSCYVFLRCGMTQQDRNHVYRVASVLGFVGCSSAATAIPDEEIERVRTALSQTATWRSHPFLKAGQRVRVKGGALDGIEGIFISENGDHSLVISVNAIQRSMAVRIDGYDVVPL
jgi:transcription antitermination factor NusG